MPDNEEPLLVRVCNSDLSAFETVFRAYQPALFRHLWFKCRDSELASDIVQETFLRVWEKRSSIDPRRAFLPYIITIGSNLLGDHFRHARVVREQEPVVPLPEHSEGDEPEEAFHLHQLEEQIDRIVRECLPERCRAIFLLSRVEGKCNSEIAAMFGISLKTVENQITTALKILRRKLPGPI
jgi:RNA polymerase sigma-70 factor (family 1)